MTVTAVVVVAVVAVLHVQERAKMKITKRHLKQIIREEKIKLLHESVSDMMQIDTEVSQASSRIADQFLEMMFQLFDEDPEMFAGRSTESEWEQQVNEARHDLEVRLRDAINDTIEQVEMNLHDGGYHRGNR